MVGAQLFLARGGLNTLAASMYSDQGSRQVPGVEALFCILHMQMSRNSWSGTSPLHLTVNYLAISLYTKLPCSSRLLAT